MTDEYKPLIVEGEKVGDYDDTTISFDKWCMETVELWTSPKEFDAYQYDWETFKEFYKEEYGDGEYYWSVEDMGESHPDRYYYKDGKIEYDWTTPMEEEE